MNPPFVPCFCLRLRLCNILPVFVLIGSLSTWSTTYADSPQSQLNPSLISTFRPHRLLASFLSYTQLATTLSSTPSSSPKSKKAVKIQSMNSCPFKFCKCLLSSACDGLLSAVARPWVQFLIFVLFQFASADVTLYVIIFFFALVMSIAFSLPGS